MATSGVMNNFQQSFSCPSTTTSIAMASPADTQTSTTTAASSTSAAAAFLKKSRSFFSLIGIGAAKSNFIQTAQVPSNPVCNNGPANDDIGSTTHQHTLENSSLIGSFPQRNLDKHNVELPPKFGNKSAYVGNFSTENTNRNIGERGIKKTEFIDFCARSTDCGHYVPGKPETPLLVETQTSKLNNQVENRNSLNIMASITGGDDGVCVASTQSNTTAAATTDTGGISLQSHTTCYHPANMGSTSANGSNMGHCLNLIKGAFRNIGSQPATTWINPGYISTAQPHKTIPGIYNSAAAVFVNQYQQQQTSKHHSTRQHSPYQCFDSQFTPYPDFNRNQQQYTGYCEGIESDFLYVDEFSALCSGSLAWQNSGMFSAQQLELLKYQQNWQAQAQREQFLIEQELQYLYYQRLHQEKQQMQSIANVSSDTMEENLVDNGWCVVSNEACSSLPSVAVPTGASAGSRGNNLVGSHVATSLLQFALPSLSCLKVDLPNSSSQQQQFTPNDFHENVMLDTKHSDVGSYQLCYSESAELQVQDAFSYQYSNNDFSMSSLHPYNRNIANDNFIIIGEKSIDIEPYVDCYVLSNSIPLNPYAKEWTIESCINTSKLNPEAKEWVPKTKSNTSISEDAILKSVTESAIEDDIVLVCIENQSSDQENIETEIETKEKLTADTTTEVNQVVHDEQCRSPIVEKVLCHHQSHKFFAVQTKESGKIDGTLSKSCPDVEDYSLLSEVKVDKILPDDMTTGSDKLSNSPTLLVGNNLVHFQSIAPDCENKDDTSNLKAILKDTINVDDSDDSEYEDDFKEEQKSDSENEQTFEDDCDTDDESDASDGGIIFSCTYGNIDINCSSSEDEGDDGIIFSCKFSGIDIDGSSSEGDSDLDNGECCDTDDDDGIMFCTNYEEGENNNTIRGCFVSDSCRSEKTQSSSICLLNLQPAALIIQSCSSGPTRPNINNKGSKKSSLPVQVEDIELDDDWCSDSDGIGGCISAGDWAFGVKLMNSNNSIKIQTKMLIYAEKERKNSLTDVEKANLNWDTLVDENVIGNTGVKVSFDDTVTVFSVDKDVERKGEWEMYARDRMRFRNRIENLSGVLSCVLKNCHRSTVFEDRFKTDGKQCLGKITKSIPEVKEKITKCCKIYLRNSTDNTKNTSVGGRKSTIDSSVTNPTDCLKTNFDGNTAAFSDKATNVNECDVTEVCLPINLLLDINAVLAESMTGTDKLEINPNAILTENSCKLRVVLCNGVATDKKHITVDKPR